MSEDEIGYVLAHEQAHIQRKDHWWKPLGFLLLTVHWFNPLLWVAYVLLCRDIEQACDEKVIAPMDSAHRKGYSEALLACSVSRRTIMACPVAFGELSVKARIQGILSYKKPAFWIIIVAVIAVSAYFVSKGLSSVTTVLAFMQYFTLISMAMMAISRLFVIFSKASASAGRVAEVLDTPADLEVKKETDYPPQITKPFICFDKVSFAYNNTKNVLHDISFTLEKGQSLGIIGATGSGKTTILALLMRLYDVTEGEILYNGINIRDYDLLKYREKFASVFQDYRVFAMTVSENVLTEEITEENKRFLDIYEVWIKPDPYKHRAMRMCGVDEEYRHFCRGTGQRQRLLPS